MADEPRYIRLSEGDPLPDLSALRPFKALLIVDEEPSADWQNSVSAWLVDQGCLYMMAWGKDCSSWDTSVDDANLANFGFGDIPDDKAVMTTWHDDWTPSDVFHFAKFMSIHPTVNISNIIFIHIGSIDKRSSFIADFMSTTYE